MREEEVTAQVAAELRVAKARMSKPPVNAHIAAIAGVSEVAIGRYLKGERAIPLPTFVAICFALGVDPGGILDSISNPNYSALPTKDQVRLAANDPESDIPFDAEPYEG
ncbi:helix-turn-helix domain-containing protein [Arthrobacter sp. NPDC090010]|uniref:helix-turn-helix domain-containing protein n=1 Tax=Arthrobacter sp. NPDC090010 TaxID=3363942 RepID=UPI003801D2BB